MLQLDNESRLERKNDQADAFCYSLHEHSIAEDVIYMIEGRIVRHKAEDYKS